MNKTMMYFKNALTKYNNPKRKNDLLMFTIGDKQGLIILKNELQHLINDSILEGNVRLSIKPSEADGSFILTMVVI